MKLVFLNGIGDFLMYDSFWTDQYKREIEEIQWAAKVRPQLQPLVECLYPWVRHTNTVDDSVWEKTVAFTTKSDAIKRGGALIDDDTYDLNVLDEFPRIEKQPFQGGWYMTQECGDISSFDLPDAFAVVHPYTTLNRLTHRQMRDFREEDWDVARRWLEQRDLTGVVLNVGNEPVPNGFVDLTNRTTVGEGIEILKRAQGYCGIDSWMSIVAAKLFENEMLHVLSRNTFFDAYKHLYHCPKTDFTYLRWGFF